MEHILYFFIYSFFGWLCECLYCGIPARRFINRGFLEGPYCPIYGFGALIVLYILQPFADRIVLLFLAGLVLTSVLEYITSYLMEKLFHSKWWDYSSRRLNINGRVCLRNSLMFGVLGVIVVRVIHPMVQMFLQQIPFAAQTITAIVLTGLFLWDNIHTFHAILRENEDYRLLEDSLRELTSQFRETSIFPLEEPLSQKITQILEQTDADEKLMIAIENLQQQYQQRMSTFRHTKQRLSQAFPKRLKQVSHENVSALFKAFDEHKQMIRNLKQKSEDE